MSYKDFSMPCILCTMYEHIHPGNCLSANLTVFAEKGFHLCTKTLTKLLILSTRVFELSVLFLIATRT